MTTLPQTPAEGIWITKEFPNALFFNVACECGNDDDQIQFEIEIDDNQISLNMWTKQQTQWWKDPFNNNAKFKGPAWLWNINYSVRWWLNSLHHRCKVTWIVWTKGYVEYEQTTLLSKQQTLNLAYVLLNTVNKYEEKLNEK
jgi:hypothetical protein